MVALHNAELAPDSTERQVPTLAKVGTMEEAVRAAFLRRARSITGTVRRSVAHLDRSVRSLAERSGQKRGLWRRYLNLDDPLTVTLAALEVDRELALDVYARRIEVLKENRSHHFDGVTLDGGIRQAMHQLGEVADQIDRALANDGEVDAEEARGALRPTRLLFRTIEVLHEKLERIAEGKKLGGKLMFRVEVLYDVLGWTEAS